MLPTNIGNSDSAPAARTQVVGLSEHKSRRNQRLQLARAMQSGDPVRSVLIEHLVALAEITGADRAAAVWVDEYSATDVRPLVTLDLLCDRPRRAFPVEPLERAWAAGLPGVYEGLRGSTRSPSEPASQFAVALGSDGARSWFLVCDSVGLRARLSEPDRQRALFLSGEAAGALLHQDLDRDRDTGILRIRDSGARGFVGFPVLEDCEGREDDVTVTATVEQRFLAVRLARSLVDEEPGDADAARWADRVESTRVEIVERARRGGDALQEWSDLLDALARKDLSDVAEGLVAAGKRAEIEGHTHGALELYRCAFDAAAVVLEPGPAVDAARFRGRIQRRSARWAESIRAYQLAYRVAAAAGLTGKAAQALGGLASVRQEIGNLPEARKGYQEALELASRSGSRDVLANIHQGLLALEHAAGNAGVALRHGWAAVATYEDPDGKVRCLANLAGTLVDVGDRAAAEDAWTIVARQARDVYYRTYAHDALAYLAALRGDLGEFEAQAALCDALGWESGSKSAAAEILYYRGLSYRALGMLDAAERWLTRAVAHADRFGLNRTLFRAEEALDQLRQMAAGLARAAIESETTAPSAPPEVREGLREMRRAAVGALV